MRNPRDHVTGWRYVARAEYEKNDGSSWYIDALMRRVAVIDGMVSISEKDLKDLLASAWWDGKGD